MRFTRARLRHPRFTRATLIAVLTAALVAAPAAGTDRPRYDVPQGYRRCPHATAWHGFFKWASARGESCRSAAAFMRAYADAVGSGPMPRHVRGYRCRIRYWRDEDGQIYASRHVCTRKRAVVRFYGMV